MYDEWIACHWASFSTFCLQVCWILHFLVRYNSIYVVEKSSTDAKSIIWIRFAEWTCYFYEICNSGAANCAWEMYVCYHVISIFLIHGKPTVHEMAWKKAISTDSWDQYMCVIVYALDQDGWGQPHGCLVRDLLYGIKRTVFLWYTTSSLQWARKPCLACWGCRSVQDLTCLAYSRSRQYRWKESILQHALWNHLMESWNLNLRVVKYKLWSCGWYTNLKHFQHFIFRLFISLVCNLDICNRHSCGSFFSAWGWFLCCLWSYHILGRKCQAGWY